MFCKDPEDCAGYCVDNMLIDRVLSYQVKTREGSCIYFGALHTGGLMHPAPEEFIKSVMEVSEDNGILLIFDELQSEMGLIGKMGTHYHYGVEPDILMLPNLFVGEYHL